MSLCRANATQSILDALSQLASAPSTADPLEGQTAAEPASSPESRLTSDDLKLIESFLRALRSLVVALADEVSPGSRWQRLPGVGYRYNQAIMQSLADQNGNSSGLQASVLGKSSREVIGWHIADAGFPQKSMHTATKSAAKKQRGDGDGDLKMNSASSSDLRSDAARDKGDKEHEWKSEEEQAFNSPHAELVWLARKAITAAFASRNLPLWLGTLFVARLPVSSFKAPAWTTKSRGGSRPGTRPGSPGRPGATASNSRPGSSRGAESSPAVGLPAHSNQVKVLAITEMVSGVLSSGLCIASTDVDAAEALSSSTQDYTPVLILSQRRRAVLEFTADQSPFWAGRSATTVPARAALTHDDVFFAADDEGERGRDGAGLATQASFVKRGKSSENRDQGVAMDEGDDQAFANLVDAHRGPLDVLLEATECGYAKTQEAALWALTDLSRENTETSAKLFNCLTPSGLIPTSMLLNLRKDPSASVRLAAFCWWVFFLLKSL